jgi:hypothetical protein
MLVEVIEDIAEEKQKSTIQFLSKTFDFNKYLLEKENKREKKRMEKTERKRITAFKMEDSESERIYYHYCFSFPFTFHSQY